ncbi:phage tail tube protein [Anaerosinus massiliensis]|uniref:phage tail tube protein n=1 Tax=Massilibacillus massiliensis TaxID=1806837 RepID=UPI000DA5F258|nr:phage tail tube protein [Massilibacillus massiliensis]
MKGMKAQQVMSGTHGELWIDGDYMAQITEFKAQVNLKKTAVNIVKTMGDQFKMTGWEGKGSLKMNKVSSYMIRKLNDNMKQGKQTTCTIVSKLSDPDAVGTERVVIKDAVFDSLTLADWTAKKIGEESYNFTFTDWDILDSAAD